MIGRKCGLSVVYFSLSLSLYSFNAILISINSRLSFSQRNHRDSTEKKPSSVVSLSRAFSLRRFSVQRRRRNAITSRRRQINLSNSGRGGKNARERRDHISEHIYLCMCVNALDVCVTRRKTSIARDETRYARTGYTSEHKF